MALKYCEENTTQQRKRTGNQECIKLFPLYVCAQITA